jgi:hypothetical protein
MSDFSRRGFLQMLGLGGMALAIEARKPIPLFGSDEEEAIVTPEPTLLKGHVVVAKKGITERIPKDDPVWNKYGPNSGVVPVARLTRSQVPGGGELRSLQEHKLHIAAEIPPGADPHVVYYRAANDLRDQFMRLSRQKLLDLDPELRRGAVIVTVVESPILATSRHTWEEAHRDRWKGQRVSGFDVTAYFRQGIRYSTKGLDTFNIYSEQGEYPIDVPKDIDLALLMKMDREVLSDSTLLVGDPRRWRPSRRTSRIFTA